MGGGRKQEVERQEETLRLLQARAANQKNKWQGRKRLSHTHKHHTINDQEEVLVGYGWRLWIQHNRVSLLRGGRL